MKKLAVILLLSGGLAACQSDSRSDRMLGLGAIGAATGGVVGGLVSGDAGGVLVGAALGGAGGAMLGAGLADSEERNGYGRPRVCRGYDEYGNPVRVRC
jgi:osmotically inducible lipoprotein OsmB